MAPKSKRVSNPKPVPKKKQANPPGSGDGVSAAAVRKSSRARRGKKAETGESSPLEIDAVEQPGFVMVGDEKVPAALHATVVANKSGYGCTGCTIFVNSSVPVASPLRFHLGCVASAGGFPSVDSIEFTTFQKWKARVAELVQTWAVAAAKQTADQSASGHDPRVNNSSIKPSANSKDTGKGVNKQRGRSSRDSGEDTDEDAEATESDEVHDVTTDSSDSEDTDRRPRKRHQSRGHQSSRGTPLLSESIRLVTLIRDQLQLLVENVSEAEFAVRHAHFTANWCEYLERGLADHAVILEHRDFRAALVRLGVPWKKAGVSTSKPNLSNLVLGYVIQYLGMILVTFREVTEAQAGGMGARLSRVGGAGSAGTSTTVFETMVDMSSEPIGFVMTLNDVQYVRLNGQPHGLRLEKISSSSSSTSQTLASTAHVALAAKRLGIPVVLAQNPAVLKFIKHLEFPLLPLHAAGVVTAISCGELPPLSGMFAQYDGVAGTTDRGAICEAVKKVVQYNTTTYTDTEEVTAELIELVDGLPQLLGEEHVQHVFVQAWKKAVDSFNGTARRKVAEAGSSKSFRTESHFERVKGVVLPLFRPTLIRAIDSLVMDYQQQLRERESARMSRSDKKRVRDPGPAKLSNPKGGKYKVGVTREKGEPTRAVEALRVGAGEELAQPARRAVRGPGLCKFFQQGVPCSFQLAGKCRFSHSEGNTQ
jgi:hypothetical protein